jgi:hypothetical protein
MTQLLQKPLDVGTCSSSMQQQQQQQQQQHNMLASWYVLYQARQDHCISLQCAHPARLRRARMIRLRLRPERQKAATA